MKADWEANLTGTTRRAFTTGLAAVGVSPIPGLARAQTSYPAGLTIKFIVGYPAGGGQDVVGRIVADRLGALWKVPTIVENISGAAANIGMDRVAKGPADGTQVLIIPPNISTNQFLYARMPFNPETDIVPLSLVASLPNLLCVRKDLAVNSVPELIAYAKANPGKLNYALPRHRHHGASLRRALQAHGRRRDGRRALPRQRSRAQRARRPEHRSDVRQHHLDH